MSLKAHARLSVRPFRVVKHTTPTTKKYRFQTFNDRISKLNINPIRQVRRQDVEKEDIDAKTSHFNNALAKWRDLNLSDNFQSFVLEIEPLSDSLPQILHYQQRIVDGLVKYLEKNDGLSLEPLLDLVAQLAHDLGARFERHFKRTLEVVAAVVTLSRDVEAIEWGFNCLAWLFKYLSRLLVPDLRPSYDIMAPLLGRGVQRPHLAKFAAGSMSFLVKKAALSHHKDPEFLRSIVSHVLKDLDKFAENKDCQVYKYGVMTLFAESMKGINRGMNSCATIIYRTLLEEMATNRGGTYRDVLLGLTTNLVHASDAGGFKPILDCLISHVQSLSQETEDCIISVCSGLLYIVVGVRKGTRVADWESVNRILVKLAQLRACHSQSNLGGVIDIEKAVAVAVQLSPLDVLLPYLRLLLDAIGELDGGSRFLSFCVYVAELGQERFDVCVKSAFVNFVSTNWRAEEKAVLVIGIRLLSILEKKNDGAFLISCPDEWQTHIAELFSSLVVQPDNVPVCNAYLEIRGLLGLNETTIKSIDCSIASVVQQVLEGTKTSSAALTKFGATVGFQNVCDDLRAVHTLKISLSTCLRALLHYSSMPIFLKSVATCCKVLQEDIDLEVVGTTINVLKPNLASPSSSLRVATLKLLDELYKKQYGHESEAIMHALTIESIPVDMQSARTLTMHVRRLISIYRVIPIEDWTSRTIIYYCYGLLSLKLSPVWDEVVEVLRIICESKEAEGVVADIALSWISRVPISENIKVQDSTNEKTKQLNEFECSNIYHLNELMKDLSNEHTNLDTSLYRASTEKSTSEPLNASSARSQALRVLCGLPHIAEKRSRQLSPLFLQWMSKEDETGSAGTEDLDSDATLDFSDSSLQSKVTRRDQQDLLSTLR